MLSTFSGDFIARMSLLSGLSVTPAHLQELYCLFPSPCFPLHAMVSYATPLHLYPLTNYMSFLGFTSVNGWVYYLRHRMVQLITALYCRLLPANRCHGRKSATSPIYYLLVDATLRKFVGLSTVSHNLILFIFFSSLLLRVNGLHWCFSF